MYQAIQHSQSLSLPNWNSRLGMGRRGQRGLSVIGVMLGLVVAAVFMLVILNAFQEASTRQKGEAAANEAAILLAATQKIYRESYEDMSTESVIQAGLVPPRMRVQGAGGSQAAVNIYNQPIVFGPSPEMGEGGAGVGRQLGRMTYPVERANCAEVLVVMNRMAFRIRVDDTLVKDENGLDLARAAQACAGNAGGEGAAAAGRYARLDFDYGAAGL